MSGRGLGSWPRFLVTLGEGRVDMDLSSVRPVAVTDLGQKYRRYRLADPEAEAAMAGSLRRWGQLAPVVACVQDERLELVDGFKRQAAACLCGLTTLSVKVVTLDERVAKAALLSLNSGQRPARELEEAWVVQALVREDGLTQVEAAQLLGRHKSWVRWPRCSSNAPVRQRRRGRGHAVVSSMTSSRF